MTPERMRSIRRTLGWTQRRLAQEWGVTVGYISNLERGRRRITNVQALVLESWLAAMTPELRAAVAVEEQRVWARKIKNRRVNGG